MASLTHKIFASLKAGGTASTASSSESPNADFKVSTSPSTSPTAAWNERFCHVAVQGCCHGELDRIYDACALHEQQTGKRIDVLICCGDFQAVRTARDMDSMAVPDKFKVMGDFHKYWHNGSSSAAQSTAAPYLTIFVGGNHENSDLLAQESYGGFVAPNIYYLGHSGVVTVDNCLRVAGLSGIFKDQDYCRPYPPRPYAANYGWKKGAYHVRRIEVAKLHTYMRAAQALRQPTADEKTASPLVDIFVSHDWPVGITAYGDEAQLLRHKPYFRDDIRHHALGNPHTMQLLREAQPVYWVAAHLHCFFEATVPHLSTHTSDDAKKEEGGTSACPAPTKFVALDKCAKNSGFLTFLDLPRRPATELKAKTAGDDGAARTASHVVAGAVRIQRDPLWLEVLLASHPYVAENRATETGGAQQSGFDVSNTVRELVARRLGDAHASRSPSAAAMTAASTEALLKELQLCPALPLQLQEQPQSQATHHSEAASVMPVHYGQNRRSAAQWTAPQADPNDLQRLHQRPRTERPPDVTASAPAAPAPLSFFEDVGTAAAPPSSIGNANAAPAPLGWYEDTAA